MLLPKSIKTSMQLQICYVGFWLLKIFCKEQTLTIFNDFKSYLSANRNKLAFIPWQGLFKCDYFYFKIKVKKRVISNLILKRPWCQINIVIFSARCWSCEKFVFYAITVLYLASNTCTRFLRPGGVLRAVTYSFMLIPR